MLPAVSSVDCLVTDLGMDPGAWGLQQFEATNFLLFARAIDVTVPLLLWQISVVGESRGPTEPNAEGLGLLTRRLADLYGPEHEVVVYEACPYPAGRPYIQRVRIRELQASQLTPLCSLFVPPASEPKPDPSMVTRLASLGQRAVQDDTAP